MIKLTQKNYEAIKIYNQKEKIFTLKGEIQSLKEENNKLKEQLKDCLEVLEMVASETIDFPRTVDACIDKINQTLGEDK